MSVIHDNFADWLSPAGFGLDASQFQSREEVVEKIATALQKPLLLELVRLVFKRPVEVDDTVLAFRKEFKNADATFRMAGNDAEVVALAGCVLAAVLNVATPEERAHVAVTILAASAAKSRATAVSFDLVGMAEHTLAAASRQWRSRPGVSPAESTIYSPPPQKMEGEGADAKPVPPTLEQLTTNLGSLGKVHNALAKHLHKMSQLLSYQDEELEILWWLVTGWSALSDRPFDQLSAEGRPIILAIELAEKTKEAVEMPSLRAVFSRAGIELANHMTIPTAVNAYVDANVSANRSANFCPTLTPVSLAMERALETGSGAQWIAGWSAVTGLEETKEVDAVDIAVQLYRELALRTRIL